MPTRKFCSRVCWEKKPVVYLRPITFPVKYLSCKCNDYRHRTRSKHSCRLPAVRGLGPCLTTTGQQLLPCSSPQEGQTGLSAKRKRGCAAAAPQATHPSLSETPRAASDRRGGLPSPSIPKQAPSPQRHRGTTAPGGKGGKRGGQSKAASRARAFPRTHLPRGQRRCALTSAPQHAGSSGRRHLAHVRPGHMAAASRAGGREPRVSLEESGCGEDCAFEPAGAVCTQPCHAALAARRARGPARPLLGCGGGAGAPSSRPSAEGCCGTLSGARQTGVAGDCLQLPLAVGYWLPSGYRSPRVMLKCPWMWSTSRPRLCNTAGRLGDGPATREGHGCDSASRSGTRSQRSCSHASPQGLEPAHHLFPLKKKKIQTPKKTKPKLFFFCTSVNEKMNCA